MLDPSTSMLGLGTYRWAGTDIHVEAARTALDLGCSLIDTAPNYAPVPVRRKLGELLLPRRDQIHLISKVGYTDDGGYSLDEPFIRERIDSESSLLGAGRIDSFLIHNPEHLLADSGPKQTLRMIGLAFEAVQTAIDAGTVGCFGISSNVLALPDHPLGQRALETYLGLARDHADATKFRMLQFPFNASERSARLNDWLPRCAEAGLTTVGNRPLTLKTSGDGPPIRLADPQTRPPVPSRVLVEELSRLVPELDWLGRVWGSVLSTDSLDHVEALALAELNRGGASQMSLLENVILARRIELRSMAACQTSRPKVAALLVAAGVNRTCPIARAACAAYLQHVDHVLLGVRRASDAMAVRRLFAPRTSA